MRDELETAEAYRDYTQGVLGVAFYFDFKKYFLNQRQFTECISDHPTPEKIGILRIKAMNIGSSTLRVGSYLDIWIGS